jgi:putative membrane protein
VAPAAVSAVAAVALAAVALLVVGDMTADKFFNDQEKERIQQAIVVAELKTAGEIVPMIVTSSARYTEVELYGLIAGLFLGLAIEWLWIDPWGSSFVNLWPVVGACTGFLLCQIPSIKRLVTPKNRIEAAVHTLALAAFAQHGLHYTRDHTGILILISLLEHRVEVLADRGINAKVETATWQEISKIVADGLRSDRACEAICKAIDRCGEILATHFPRQPDDRNELPDRLVTG